MRQFEFLLIQQAQAFNIPENSQYSPGMFKIPGMVVTHRCASHKLVQPGGVLDWNEEEENTTKEPALVVLYSNHSIF